MKQKKLIIFQVWGLASFHIAVVFSLQDFCLYDTTDSKRNFQVGNKSLESIQNAFHSPFTQWSYLIFQLFHLLILSHLYPVQSAYILSA